MKAIVLLIFLTFFSLNAVSIDKKYFYDVFKGGSMDSVDALLSVYEEMEPVGEELIFKGALYVKKAGFLNNLGQKIELFKKGREIVEKKIEEQPENVEFRFVRLIIQEKVPAILRYNSNKAEDAEMVIKGVNQLEKEVQEAIFDYSKNSSSLTFD
ncbi:MAG TPA: hypothetical protein VKY45_09430 [Marinilabiliaceae bacterium]|nr:hypothetical protein [Marinilabiliaceae bacterium]